MNVTPTQFLLGNGVLSHAMAGLIRIPALLISCQAVTIAGELALRGLSSILNTIGLKPSNDSWINRRVTEINGATRPYQNEEENSTMDLVSKMVSLTALGIIATEFALVVGGKAPAVYNNVLTFMGPIRISSDSYFENVGAALAAFRW